MYGFFSFYHFFLYIIKHQAWILALIMTASAMFVVHD